MIAASSPVVIAPRVALCGLALLVAAVTGCGSESSNVQANPVPVTPKAETPEPATSLWDESHEQALQAAVRWVLDNQKDAGDWGTMESRPYDVMLGSLNTLHVWGNTSSALCVTGLLMLPPSVEIDAALRRALEYLIDAPDTPRGMMSVFYNVWAHAYMITALTSAMADARFADLQPRMRQRAEHELRYLLDHQSLDGGWGYYDFGRSRTVPPSGSNSNSFTTATVLVALRQAREAGLRPARPLAGNNDVDHRIKIGLDYVERHRIPNGAYYYSTGHMHRPTAVANLPRGSIARSQPCDHSLFLWDRTLGVDDIRGALDYFFQDHVFLEIGRGRQFPHEAWYAVAPYYYYYGHYYAARNVAALPEDVRPEYGRLLADKVIAGQYDDGSFWDFPLYGYAKAYGTGYGVAILSMCKQAAGK